MLFLKITIFLLMVIGYFFCADTIEPLIKNSVYMSQMTSDGLSYVLLHGYPYIKGIYIIVSGMLFATIVVDIIEKYKNKKEKTNED